MNSFINLLRTAIFTSDIQSKKDQIHKLHEGEKQLENKAQELTTKNAELQQKVGQYERTLPMISKELQSQKAELHQITLMLKEKYKELLDITEVVMKEISVSCHSFASKLDGLKESLEKVSF